MGGALYIFSIDRLKYYETKLKIHRIIVGSLMILSGLLYCYLYEQYGNQFLHNLFNTSYSEKNIESKKTNTDIND